MGARAKRSTKALQAACDRFNREFAVGAAIDVWPGSRTDREGRPLDPQRVSVAEPGAYVMGGHTAVVQVSGGHGCIALTHVRLKAPVDG